jgi:predicted amidohydrolase YtcJ
MPDVIFFNGKLHTQDEYYRNATALAVRDGKILSLGSDDEMLALAHAETEKIDLQGRRVLPGLADAHIHFYEWAVLLRMLVLDDTRSLDDLLARVRATVSQADANAWIVGQGWNQDHWRETILPTKTDLDAVAPNNPVILWRKDLHLAVTNSVALKLAGIDRHTPNPEMGVIQHDATGEPTGLLNELAINLVRDVMPAPTDEFVDGALQERTAQLHKLGITSVHDFRIMGDENGGKALRTFQRLHGQGALKMRVCAMLAGEYVGEAIRMGVQSGFGDDTLWLGGIKLFSDGALGPRTGWMLEPYAKSNETGMPLTPMREMAEKIALAQKSGLGTTIHAIGDRAVRELLDVYSEVLDGAADSSRHRIEHVQHSHPDDLKRLAPLGLVASVQPLHLVEDMQMVDDLLGERGRWAYAFRDLLDAGTVLAFGSDCPVVSPNPFVGIQAAVTRQKDTGLPVDGWYPSQRLTVAESVYAYTMGAAIASGRQERIGSLSPGKLADLVVLDRDIFEIPPLEIGKTQVVMTIFDGEIVYRA